MELIRRVYVVSVQCFLMAAALVGLMVFLTFLPVHYSATAIQGAPAPSTVSSPSLSLMGSFPEEMNPPRIPDSQAHESGPPTNER
jgi:hypothetical protein